MRGTVAKRLRKEAVKICPPNSPRFMNIYRGIKRAYTRRIK